MVTFAKIKRLASALAEVEQSTSYGTPAFKVLGKLVARLEADEETLVLSRIIVASTHAGIGGAESACVGGL